MSDSSLSSSSSSSSTSPARTVTLRISDISNYIEGTTTGYYVKLEVIDAVGVDKELFVFQRKPGSINNDGLTYHDDFSNIASPSDLEEYPINAPEDEGTFFRTSVVELVFRSMELLNQSVIDIKADICSLLETLDQMAEHTEQTVVLTRNIPAEPTSTCTPTPAPTPDSSTDSSDSSLSSSSWPAQRSVTLCVGTVSTYVEGSTTGYYIEVEVTAAVGLEKEIFVYQRKPGAMTQDGLLYRDDFSNVASPSDLEEYPITEPDSDGTFYRTSIVKLVFRSMELLNQSIEDLKGDICSLLETLAQMAALTRQTIVIDETCVINESPPCPPMPVMARLVAATRDPEVTDDAESGFGLGSVWTNTVTQQTFVLMDNTNGAAVWVMFGTDISAHNQIPHRDVYPAHPLNAIQVDIVPNTSGLLSPHILTDDDRHKIITNEGSIAENYQQLPAAVAGYSISFVNYAAAGIRITAAAGDTIRIVGTDSKSGGYIRSVMLGSTVQLVAINSSTWIALSALGQWEVEVS